MNLTTSRVAAAPVPDLRTAASAFAAAIDGRVIGFMPRRVIGGTEWSLRSGRDFLGTVTIEGCLTFYTLGHFGVPHEIRTASDAVRVVLAKSGVAV